MTKNFNNNETFQAAQINKILKNFGINQLDPKQPMFRLVWSEFQKENRLGEFNEYCGPIFIRTFTGVKEVPKYNYIKDRWILEQWYPPAISYNKELPESRYGSYEPIYVFEDKDGNRLPLNQTVVEMIIYAKYKDDQTPTDRRMRMKLEQEIKDKKLQSYCEDMIDTSDIISNLHFKEGIIVPSNHEVESPNLRKSENS